ncbi:RND family transporter [Candidatus Cloacimonadota bacterium]
MKWNRFGELIVNKHKIILVIATFVTLAAIFFTSRLKIKTQMMDLLPQKEELVINFNKIMNNFDAFDTVIIGIEGEEQDIINYIKFIEDKVEDVFGVDRVITESQVDFLQKNLILLTEREDLENLETMLTADNLRDFVKGLNENFENSYTSGSDSENLSKDKTELLMMTNTLQDFLTNLKDPNPERSQRIADEFVSGKKYMISPDRSMGLIFARTSISTMDGDGTLKLINGLEEVLFKHEAEFNVEANVTGLHAIQRDELVTTERDMSRSSLISLLLIILIFILGFRLIRYSVMAVIPLILGIIWALALTYILIGYLNLMTMMLGAILIGLGIDYSIHVISLFNERRISGGTVDEAIIFTFEKAIPGVISGSITTALGFFVFSFSSFKGFSEFGIVLGIGIFCTLIASIFVLPSLLKIFGKKRLKQREHNGFMLKFESFIINKRWLVVALILLALAWSFYKMNSVRFETDMMKIEPKGLASIELNKKLIDKFEFTSDTSILVSESIEETRMLKEEFDDLSTVGSIDTIVDYLPTMEEQQERAEYGALVKSKLKSEPSFDLYLDELSEELFRLENNLIELSDLAYVGAEKKIVTYCDTIVNSGIIADLAEDIYAYESNIVSVQKQLISRYQEHIAAANIEETITLENLPDNIKENYLGKDGKIMTTIYPESDVWQEKFQNLHVSQLSPYIKNLSGNLLVMLKVISISGSEGKKVLVWTVILIFIVLLIDLRNFKYATLAMLPMIASFVLLLGIMGTFDIKFTMMSVIALPMIIGIGVDDGIHLIHRYKIEKQLLPTVRSTGRAITMTTLTTIAAFGTLMVSEYRGFIGYGLLLTLGIGLAYLMTVCFLVSLISIVDKVKK